MIDKLTVDDDWDDMEEIDGDLNCPNCGEEYDEIDYEYQICTICGYNNNPPTKQ